MLPKGFLFKKWVPEWLIKITLFIVLLPSLVLFFLPMANINAAAGNTGSETYDVYFSVALFYAGYVSFFSLERRFFKFLAAKEYFIVITIIQIISSYICYSTKEITVLFIFRFIQGMAFTMTVNLSLALIYARLRTERARVIGYSIFFGMLVCMIPFNNFITAEIIDSFDYDLKDLPEGESEGTLKIITSIPKSKRSSPAAGSAPPIPKKSPPKPYSRFISAPGSAPPIPKKSPPKPYSRFISAPDSPPEPGIMQKISSWFN